MDRYISFFTGTLLGRIVAPRVWFPSGFDNIKTFRKYLQYCEDSEEFRHYYLAHKNICPESVCGFTTRIFESFPKLFIYLMECPRFPRNIAVTKKRQNVNGFFSQFFSVKMKDNDGEKSKIMFRCPGTLDLQVYFDKRHCTYNSDQMCWKYNHAAYVPVNFNAPYPSLTLDYLEERYPGVMGRKPPVVEKNTGNITRAVLQNTEEQSTSEQSQKCIVC